MEGRGGATVRGLDRLASLRRLVYTYRVARRLGGTRRSTCSCCGWQGRFRAFGHPPRYDALCRKCGALERHRLFALALRDGCIDIDGCDLLHFAAEPVLTRMLRERVRNYATADITPGRGDYTVDIQSTGLRDASWDVIVASHVLEHVSDDAKALRECHRLLRDDGVLVVMMPIVEGWRTTYEDPSIADPLGRRVHFGQDDHVRFYGADLSDRLRDAGYTVREFSASPQQCAEYSLLRGEKIFLATSA